MRSLLDINVLLALFDRDHIDHERAREWLTANVEEHGWASCALTQNGFVRIISQPRYPHPISIAEAIELLGAATRTNFHAYWPCSVSLLDGEAIDSSHLLGSKQLTDAYLLALAVEHGGRFVTFDRSIPRSAVRRADSEHLVAL